MSQLGSVSSKKAKPLCSFRKWRHPGELLSLFLYCGTYDHHQQSRMPGAFCYPPPFYCLETRSFSTQELAISVRLAGQQALGLHLQQSLSAGTVGIHSHIWLFMWVPGLSRFLKPSEPSEPSILPTEPSP